MLNINSLRKIRKIGRIMGEIIKKDDLIGDANAKVGRDEIYREMTESHSKH